MEHIKVLDRTDFPDNVWSVLHRYFIFMDDFPELYQSWLPNIAGDTDEEKIVDEWMQDAGHTDDELLIYTGAV